MSTLPRANSSGKKRKAVNVELLSGEHYTVYVDVSLTMLNPLLHMLFKAILDHDIIFYF